VWCGLVNCPSATRQIIHAGPIAFFILPTTPGFVQLVLQILLIYSRTSTDPDTTIRTSPFLKNFHSKQETGKEEKFVIRLYSGIFNLTVFISYNYIYTLAKLSVKD